MKKIAILGSTGSIGSQALEVISKRSDEFVVTATGTMRERAPELKNPNIETGDIELVASDLKLLNKSEPLPVNTHDDGEKSSEEMRLKYRYLDLRRPSMLKLMQERSRYYAFLLVFIPFEYVRNCAY